MNASSLFSKCISTLWTSREVTARCSVCTEAIAVLILLALTATYPMLLRRIEQSPALRDMSVIWGFIAPRRQVSTCTMQRLSIPLRCHQHLGQCELGPDSGTKQNAIKLVSVVTHTYSTTPPQPRDISAMAFCLNFHSLDQKYTRFFHMHPEENRMPIKQWHQCKLLPETIF